MKTRHAPIAAADWIVRLEAFLRAPVDVILSEPFPAPAPLRDHVRCTVLEPPAGAMDAAGATGWDDLARCVLADSEQAVWQSVGAAKRRREWLLGRIAAKDAVRMHLRAARGLTVPPSHVVIGADAAGRPSPGGPVLESLDIRMAVSLSHTEGIAMALVAEAEWGAGIDVERLSRRRGDYAEAAFSKAELARLDAGGAASLRAERALRLWCAKEAVAKALGRGLMGNPMNLETQAIDAGWSRIDLAVAGSLARALPGRAGRPVTAHVAIEGDLVVAAALAGPPPDYQPMP